MPVRRLMKLVDGFEVSSVQEQPPPHPQLKGGGGGSTRLVRAPPKSTEIEALLRADPVVREDIHAALATTKPSSDGNIERYNAWQRDYGSV